MEKLMAGHRRQIDINDFSYIVGLSIEKEWYHHFGNIYNDLAYRFLLAHSRDRIILEVLKAINSNDLSEAGEKGRWDIGWSQNLTEYRETGDPVSLIPRYLLRRGQPIRVHGDYAIANDDSLIELAFYRLYRMILFLSYFDNEDIDTVYEFGCGSGHNLITLAEMFPDKRIVGLDWSQPAVDIANLLGGTYPNISGRKFDFFAPDDELEIGENTAILTIGALEQTGTRYPVFTDWLVAREPRLCIHIEPQPDWYDQCTVLGYLGVRFLQVRNYWTGFPNYLYGKTREDFRTGKGGEVDVIEHRPVPFGSLFIEGYNRLVWRSGKYRGSPIELWTTNFNLSGPI